MKNFIHIGPRKEDIAEARKSIICILTIRGADQPTIRAALRAFTQITSVSNVSISNCVFTERGKK